MDTGSYWKIFPCLVFLLCLPDKAVPEAVNMALNKPISALFTCGWFVRSDPLLAEEYFDHVDVEKSNRDRTLKKCYDTTLHPPSAMVDNNLETKWQSANLALQPTNSNFSSLPRSTDDLNAVIYLDLKQTLKVESIILRLGDAQRPGYIAIHKSNNLSNSDTTTTTDPYDVWAYKVNFNDDCDTKFSVPSLTVPTALGDAVCERYPTQNSPTFYDVVFNFTQTPANLREWQRVRYIRIELYSVEMTLSREAHLFHHFAIRELEVMAECVCNGHQIGCPLNDQSGLYECECGGNTVGQFCERCKPRYNQMAWAVGQDCVECNCHSHATECTYNENLAANNLSLNMEGEFIGGGECLNCQDNTAGVNCEKCKPYFYRPTGVNQTHPNACMLCQCNSAGTGVSPVSGVDGDCVMNKDYATEGKSPGDCYCKENVNGTKCDTCREGFYNLDISNPLGCQACDCNIAGTVDGRSDCSEETGQCPCKTDVTGLACDTCNDGFYGLNTSISTGCLPCECDPGGAISNVCEKETGQCSCRPNLQGRQCNSPVPGYYYPEPHFIHTEFESVHGVYTETALDGYMADGYVSLVTGDFIDPVLIFPGGSTLNGTCAFLIRYSTTNDSTVSMDIKTSEDPRPLTVDFPGCANRWCYRNVGEFKKITLQGSTTHTCRIIAMGPVLLDRIVCVPVQFLDTDSLLGSNTFSSNCDVINNDMKLGTALESTCKSGLLSVMSYYLNGLRGCGCSPIGADLSKTCDSFGGKCVCKEGVGERRCDGCQPGFYQLSVQGCTDCNCTGDTSLCDANTGQCQCPLNTIGLKCDHCDFNTWGLDPSSGCKECNCNAEGSERSWCDIETGECTCKTGVMGNHCDQCMDEYKLFSSLGCSRCACSEVGSTGPVCNKTSGQCDCKENTEDVTCGTCRSGSFNLEEGNTKGCLDCICMGVASTCSSSQGRHRTKTVPLYLAESGGLIATISITDSAGTDLSEPAVEVSEVTDTVPIATSAKVTIPSGSEVYWKIPELVGNLLDVYGGWIQADVVYISITQGSGTPQQTKAILIGRNNKRLMKNIDLVTAETATSIRIQMSETGWIHEADSVAVTRGEFLLALIDVQMVLIPAAFTNVNHVSFLTRLKYSEAGSVGEVAAAVEECDCSTPYTGLSCESCSPGYRRLKVETIEYLGECVPCVCNNHSNTCDPDTGVCLDCQHHTTGANCEKCSLGFYGNATAGTTTDCIECSCHEPGVVNMTCSETSGVVKCSFCKPGYIGDLCKSCELFHFGTPETEDGTCTPCDCNGNSDVCDPQTGVCSNCQNNSEGPNCELCVTGFYRNPATNSCEACGCVEQGSTNTICNPADGQCTCFQGVGGRTCEKCLDNYWGYSVGNPGCLPCDCVAAGSESLQCDPTTGQCTCKDKVLGNSVKCDQCIVGYFGLPDQPCQVCDCNPTGTDPTGGNCDMQSGQCPCKEGVDGQKCDRCKTLYTGFSDTGCTACDKCESSLGEDLSRLEETWNLAYTIAQDVLGIQDRDNVIQNLSRQLNETMMKLGLSGTDISSVTQLTTEISTLESSSQQQVEELLNRVAGLKAQSQVLKNGTFTEDERLKSLLASSLELLDKAREEEQTGNNLHHTLNEWLNTARTYLVQDSSGQGSSGQGATVLNFDAQLSSASTNYQKILSDQSVEKMTTDTARQAATTRELLAEEDHVKEAVNNQSDPMATWETQLSNLQTRENSLLANQAEAKGYKDQAEATIAEITAATNSIRNMSDTASSNQAAGDAAHAQCSQIMSGPAAGLLPGVVFPEGVTNWESGYQVLQGLHNSIGAEVTSTDNDVKESEFKAQTLYTEAEVLNNTFHENQVRGDNAVKAIENFKTVIASLNSSVELASLANTTIKEARQALSTVTVTGLEAQANQSQTASSQVLSTVNSLSYDPTVLVTRLNEAQTTLSTAQSRWGPIADQLIALQNAATAVSNETAGSGITSILTEGRTFAAQASSMSRQTITALTELNSTLSITRAEAEAGKGKVDRAVNLTETVGQEANTFSGRVDTVQITVESATQHRDFIRGRQEAVESKVSSIEQKLQRAKELLAKLQKPVNFDGTSGISVDNPVSDQSLPYTGVEFQFRKNPAVTNALLFFSENTGSQDAFSVEIVEDHVQMKFSTAEGSATVTSQAALCPTCSFHVHASKYHNVGHLTVTKLSTGGIAHDTAISSSINTANNLRLNSPLTFGSLPLGVNSSKLTNTAGFQGCMHNVKFNGEDINIWALSIAAGNPPTCCPEPEVSVPQLDPGASFNGFGGLVLDPQSFNGNIVQNLKLKFRTFSPNAVLLLVGGEDIQVSLKLRLVEGRVAFQYGSAVSPDNYLVTAGTYNDGQWYQVSATKGTTNKLEMFKEDNTYAEDVISLGANIVNLTQLQGRQLAIGFEWVPNSVNEVPLATRFSGCMKEFSYTYGSSTEVRPLQDGVFSQDGVSFDGCPSKVVSGISFLSDTAYLKLNLPTVTTINTIEMELATTESNGILLYIQDVITTSRKLYLALFNGNLLLGTSSNNVYLATNNRYISDGLLHSITVDISGSVPLVEVDSVQNTGATAMSFAKSSTSPIYIGGSETPLEPSFPVKNSLIGGIVSLKINGMLLDVFQDGVISGHLASSLGEVEEPPNTPPPLPYTTPAPPPIPTCGETLTLTGEVEQDVLWFNTGSGYWERALTIAELDYYTSSLTLSIDFESYGPDGIVFLAASSLSTPTQFLAVYLKEGFLYFQVKGFSFETDLKSQHTYNSGVRYSVDFLVFGTYLVMTENTRKDYSSHAGNYNDTAIFTTISHISVGGIKDQTLIRSSIPKLPSHLGFLGGVKAITIHKRNLGATSYNILETGPSITLAGTGPYPGEVLGYGVHLDGFNSYISFGNQFVNGQLEVQLTVRNIAASAMYLNIYQASNNFIALYTVDYKMQVSVGSTPGAFTSESAGETNFCDGLAHTYSLLVNIEGVNLTVDSNTDLSSPFPDGFQALSISGNVIVGGLENQGQSFQTEVSKTSLRGCVERVTINGDTKDPGEFLPSSSGTSLGCPYLDPAN